jgi:hypothetical protein
MTELIAGPNMILQWITAAGTQTLNADYREVEWNPSVAYVETTAGQDTQVGRIPTIKDASAAVTLLGQTGGTALVAALPAGQAGTLIIGPEGTASGKRKITFPSYADGAKQTFPYADVSQITCGFTGAGAILGNFTDGAY